MRIGIIGTGRHGSRYANHIVRDVDGLVLAAISRRSDEGRVQAGNWGCRHVADWRDLVTDGGVDAVIAVVPPALHPEIARACVAAGKPLLLEKPLAVSMAAAREIVALFRQHDLPLTVGQTLRYNPVIRLLRGRLPEIGRLYSISANQRIEPSTLEWHGRPELAGAGVSYHTAVHVFDALRYITGLEIVRVCAVTRQEHNPRLEDSLAVVLEMENGVIGTVDCSKVGHARSGRFEFVGSDGQLAGDQIHNTCERIRGLAVQPLDPGAPVGTIVPLLEAWRDFLAGQGANPVSGEDGLAAVRCCQACLESARRQRWVETASL